MLPAMADDERSSRQIARSERKRSGDQSARLANLLMKLAEPLVKKLELEPELEAALIRARAVPSQIARRRAERSLAGELRTVDIGAVAERLARVQATGHAEEQPFQLAEQWRTKLLADGAAAAAEFPGTVDDELPRLIDAARREKATSRPPGAGRALFRYLVEALKVPR
jgi:ribosomal 50S subunit-associated protein YjgA (DUF615 family)